VGDSTRIGVSTSIGAGCAIGKRVNVGDGCILYPNVTIYDNVDIGRGCILHSGSVIGADGFGFVMEGDHYEKFPQVGRVEIEDYVEIGANSCVDRAALGVTSIGQGTKLDNMVHVGHNVKVGKNVVIAGQTGVSGSSVIEDGVIVGGQVGIADHVTIESGAILGAQAGIPSNKVIRGKGVVFWGTPARPIKDYLKELAVLARLARGKGKRE
jgi:UDP-3-O-[3-hydroxymyristoyl] glucosamine N-acyltransferase